MTVCLTVLLPPASAREAPLAPIFMRRRSAEQHAGGGDAGSDADNDQSVAGRVRGFDALHLFDLMDLAERHAHLCQLAAACVAELEAVAGHFRPPTLASSIG